MFSFCSHDNTIRTYGEASRHGMLIRVTCKHCGRIARYDASSLADYFGYGRPFDSVRFKCKACDKSDCEILPYENDLGSPKKRLATLNRALIIPRFNTIGEHIKEKTSVTAVCYNRVCRRDHKLDLEALARRLGDDFPVSHASLTPKLRCSACRSKDVGIRILPFSTATPN